MPTLFFLPWAQLDSPQSVGALTLLPYERGTAPGSLGATTQAALDGVLGNYADRAYLPSKQNFVPVQRAVIVRWQNDDSHAERLDEIAVGARMQECQFLVFSALAHRTYFGHFDYCNADGLTVVAQHFAVDDPASAAIRSRRRDGSSTAIVSGSRGKPLFTRPFHVDERNRLAFDQPMLEALMLLPVGSLRDRVVDSVALFNRANTDAHDVPMNAEIVMVRAALETLLAVGHRAPELIAGLSSLLKPWIASPQWHAGLLNEAVWKTRWPKASRPIEAWIEDFCASRNVAAHGSASPKSHASPIWPTHNHLLFACWLFPLLVKAVLAQENMFALSPFERDQLGECERFLAHDILAPDSKGSPMWSIPYSEISTRELARVLYGAS